MSAATRVTRPALIDPAITGRTSSNAGGAEVRNSFCSASARTPTCGGDSVSGATSK